MIRLGFSARDRRTAIVGVVVVGSLIGLARGLPALADWEKSRVAAANDAAARVSSARMSVRMLAVLRDSLGSRGRQLAAIDSAMIVGVSPAAVAADLAQALDGIAASTRFKVIAMQLRPDSAPAGSISRVAVRVTGTTDATGLAAFLRAVEGGDTPLVVRELLVSQPEPAASANKPESLHVDVLVETLARIASARAA